MTAAALFVRNLVTYDEKTVLELFKNGRVLLGHISLNLH